MLKSKILGRRREEMPDPIAFTSLPSSTSALVSPLLDLNELLIRHQSATFFFRMEGNAMVDANIHSGDLLIVDRALTPSHGNIVIAIADGEFVVRRLLTTPEYVLQTENQKTTGRVQKADEFDLWGVVTYVIHSTDEK
jgi:DNA polymerase V